MITLEVIVQQPHAQVGRDGVEAAAMHNAPFVGDSGLMMLSNHLVDKGGLTGQVHVVGSVFYAGSDQPGAVLRVGPHRCQNNAAALCESSKTGAVVAVSEEDLKLGRVGVDGR